MYKVLVQNCITRSGPDYKCHLCPCMIRSCQYEAVLEHINNSRHKEFAELHAWDQKRQTKILETIVNFTEEEYQTMVEKGIIFKSTFYYCAVCKCKCNEFQKHLATDKHWHKLHYQLTVKDEKGSGKARGKDKNNKLNQGNLSNPNDPNYQQLQENLIEVLQTDKLYRCTVCNYFITGIDETYEHIKETKHIEKFEKRKKHFTRKSKIISKTKKYIGENRYFYCSKCEVYLTANQTLLQCHCMMHLHQEQTNLNFDIIKFKFEENNKVNITCLLCNVIMDSDKTLAEHLESTKHLYKLDFFNFLNNKVIRHILAPKQKINVKILQSYNFNPHRDIYLTDFCTLCQEKPNLDSSSHLQKMKPVQKSLNKTEMFQHESTHSKLALEGDSILYKCFLCNQSFVSKTLLFNHYGKGSPHSSKFTNLRTILKEPEEEFYKQLTSINDKIEQLVLEKQKCIKPKKSKDLQFPYNKDLLDFGDKYITMCLESGNENIYNFMLDSDQIQLVEFGISLTYVTKGQRICLPCNYKFLPYLQFLYDHLQDETHIQNLCDIKEDDEELKKYSPDQISYLGLAQSCMIEKSDELVNCLACNITITNNDNDIMIHMNLEDHISKLKPWKEDIASITKTFSTIFKNPWYYADKFYCKICNLTLNREISFMKHLDEPEHEEKLKLCKTDNKINICYACSSCWYGPSNYDKHCKDFIHLRFFKRRDLMHPQMKKAAIAFLKNNVNNYVKKLIIESDKLIETNKEKELLESVEEIARNVYPHAKAYAFGSRSSYLGFPTSDVDIFLDCENVYNDIGSRNESQEYIRKLKSLFLGGPKKDWKSDGILLQPRVPIMKLQHKITGLKCDISFLNGLGVEKSKLIRNYVIAYEHCRSLILYLKKWFDVCNLYGPQAINAYAISWFTIFFLQIKGILPSVHAVIEKRNESVLVGGWQCGFAESVPVFQPTLEDNTFQDLLKNFFLYYAEFNYQTDAVCPLLGKVMKKRDFLNINDLPDEMKIYKNRLETEKLELFRYDSPMCIQDPVDLSQNITKAVNKIELGQFRKFCAESYKMIMFQQKRSLAEVCQTREVRIYYHSITADPAFYTE